MARLVPGRAAPQQGSLLQSGTGRPRFRQRWGTPGFTDRRVRGGVQVSIMVVRRVGGGPRRRQIAGGSREAGFRAESSQRSVLAGAVGESVRQVSTFRVVFTSGLYGPMNPRRR